MEEWVNHAPIKGRSGLADKSLSAENRKLKGMTGSFAAGMLGLLVACSPVKIEDLSVSDQSSEITTATQSESQSPTSGQSQPSASEGPSPSPTAAPTPTVIGSPSPDGTESTAGPTESELPTPATEIDSDGDGWSDTEELECDSAPDNPTSTPLDGDGDGICDGLDLCAGEDLSGDTDDDGFCDDTDTDDDGDGWSDEQEVECTSDPSLVDSIPTDEDNDLICDILDLCLGDNGTGDTDTDGYCDDEDEDDDNDGWSDNDEMICGTDGLLEESTPSDSDGDGICDTVDTCLGEGSGGDEDEDGVCDSSDLDDDNDGWTDEDELSCESDPLDAESLPGDLDADGLCDVLDSFEDYDLGWLGVLSLSLQGQNLGLSADVNNFPLMLRLDSDSFPDIASRTNASGSDIRFASSDGSHLPYEIESWKDGDSAVVWILIPTVLKDRATEIDMYYDNPPAGAASNSSTVFSTEHGFQGVWHLNESANNEENSALHIDATINSNDGLQGGNEDILGVMAGGQKFDGLDDLIHIANDSSLNIRDRISLSTWVRMEVAPAKDRWFSLISKASFLPAYNFYLYNDNNQINKLCVDFFLSSGWADLWDLGQSIDLNAGEWHQVTTTFDSSAFRLYVDGVLDTAVTNPGTIVDSGGIDVLLGGDGDDNLYGAMDEARIVTEVLSPDWVKLDYATQKPNQTVLVF